MNMNNEKRTQNIIFYGLIVYDFLLLIFALSTGASTMFSGLIKIINSSAALVADYMVIGGISGAFLNSFLVTSFALVLLKASKIKYTGTTIAAMLMLSGFCLFGKNIMNILPIIAGVYLFDIITKSETKTNIYVALFGTALGPIVTEIYIQLQFNVIINLLISYIAGLFLGLILTPVSRHVLQVHKGFDLYNIGFTNGVIAICFISVLRMFGFEVPVNKYHDSINDILFLSILLSFCILLIILGLIRNKEIIKGQIKINKESGVMMPDFISKIGLQNTLINMGLCGIVATLFMYFMKVPLNGPIVGTIISIIGFCACGNNFRNIFYIFLASLIGQLCGMWDLASSNTASLATLLGTGLAPIGGHYGMFAGITSGLLHISLSHFTSSLHLGLNLYNNGFVAGFVSMALVPIFELIYKNKHCLIDFSKVFKRGKDDESSTR